jgi:hypothetical protein
VCPRPRAAHRPTGTARSAPFPSVMRMRPPVGIASAALRTRFTRIRDRLSSERRSCPWQGRHAICTSVTGPAIAVSRLFICCTAEDRSVIGASWTGFSFACATVRPRFESRSTSRVDRTDLRRKVAVLRSQNPRRGHQLGAQSQRRHQIACVVSKPRQNQSIAPVFAQRGQTPKPRKRKTARRYRPDRCSCRRRLRDCLRGSVRSRLRGRFHQEPPRCQAGKPPRSGGRFGFPTLFTTAPI